MKPVEFIGQNKVFGKDQPEYLPLPVLMTEDRVITCWELTDEELAEVILTKRIWLQILTHGVVQPQCLSVEQPFTLEPEVTDATDN